MLFMIIVILVLTVKSGYCSRKGWGGENKEDFSFHFVSSIQFKFSDYVHILFSTKLFNIE